MTCARYAGVFDRKTNDVSAIVTIHKRRDRELFNNVLQPWYNATASNSRR